MAQTATILIRVLIALAIGFVGLIVFAQGIYLTLAADVPAGLIALWTPLAMGSGAALLFGAYRLLAATLRLPAQPVH